MFRLLRYFLVLVLATLMLSVGVALASAPPAKNPQNGAIGVNGRIPSAAPSSAPTITTPANGSSVSVLPIRVAGLCKNGLLVELFDNGVFSGSTDCANSSYNLQTDLFSGQNDLITRAYDALNQSSPDSNSVAVSFNDQVSESGPRVAISSAYAKRGADPGTVLTWPLSITGGSAPYAISADWGDGSNAELLSEASSGDFSINHIYRVAGTYNVTIKATDAKGDGAFLQVVAVGNGTVQQSNSSSGSANSGSTSNTQQQKIPITPLIVLGGMVIASFWLGRMHQMAAIRGGKLRKRL